MGDRPPLLILYINHLTLGIHLDLNRYLTDTIFEDTRLLSQLSQRVGLCFFLHLNAKHSFLDG